MFILYRDLVNPFRKLENLSSRKRELEYKINHQKDDLHFNYKRTIRDAISDTFELKWFILFLIVFWVIMNVVPVNGENLFYYYKELLIEPVVYATPLNEKGIIGIFIFTIMILLIEFVLFPCLICLCPFPLLFSLMMVRHVNYEKNRITKAKETIRTCEEQLPLVEAAIQETKKIIVPYIGMIPRDYRNSAALHFFSNSYFNFKVRTLPEAINLYDQHLHQQQLEQGQREMAEKMAEAQRRSEDALNDLSMQLAYMQDQIDSQEPVVINNYYYH